MKGGQGALPATAQPTHQLEEAAGVGRDESLGASVEEMSHFAVAKLLGRLWLEKVVDPGGSTAERGLGDLGKL